MLSLGDEIAKFTDPTPQVFDPEDEINIETATKVISSNTKEDDNNERSELRRKIAPLLEDRDPTYAGEKVKRRSLGQAFCKGDRLSNIDERKSVSSSEFSTSDSEDEEEEESLDELSDSDINKFKTLVHSQIDESRLPDEDSQNDEEISSEEDADDKARDDMTLQFSNFDVTSEIEKGAAVKNQKEIWNRLLEMRIKLQKLLILANKLPQGDVWKKFKDEGGKDMIESCDKGYQSVKNLMNHFVDFHSELLNKNPEITESIQNIDKSNNDEEICSDTDEEMQTDKVHISSENTGRKRKLKENYNEVLAKQLKTLQPYRNSVIQKFDEKTKLSTGRITQKSFNAFDNSTLKQIEQILQDKARLIKRTQLKRSLYRVLGRPEIETIDNKQGDDSEIMTTSKQDMLLKDYDPEIYDDDDFYRQILKDIIDSNSFGMDPAIIRKQMEIQKIRNKMKRKVDTKASKGRKLRYDIHPKVVNFMAPIKTCQISDEERASFLKCLFGGRSKS